MTSVSKITLGAAQLGMNYGSVRPSEPPDDAMLFLDAAFAAGITSFDTARLYGDSEERIGAWIGKSGKTPFLITKFPPLRAEDAQENLSTLRAKLDQSREALAGARIGLLLAHRADDIHLPGVLDILRAERDAGRVGGFGVSTYTVDQLEAALTIPDLAAAQVPLSIFDQRPVSRGLLDECARRGISVFARSLFLQGVLFAEAQDLPDYLQSLRGPLMELRGLAAANGLSMASLAFGAVAAIKGVSSLVVGMSHVSHIEENLKSFSDAPSDEISAQARSLFEDLPEEALDPRLWPKTGNK